MLNLRPQRRSVRLLNDMKLIKSNGNHVYFPAGTVFYNFRHFRSEWDSWFYEYQISGGIGLKLESYEYEIMGKGASNRYGSPVRNRAVSFR